ncbi:Mitochondrial outer membrane translocase complex, Tom37/Metaxin [Ophiocordyceps camponoti-floridani]|uniref:Mitochondrial outer membrane translocase complex, Tom37/Metaxin n=1 Tax=Ophiocordyceps camponoti-floridani TaxID=2030778 RepID=A0A8H4QAX1_9HYPO|nr:Mitochondrial outer membrane translocase complex, Tom37/Metaxin [Ophiocordyceps camponoti-floridani]
MELHVWGPAFGLASVDAECLAAIAYLGCAVGRGGWRLVACSDPSCSPHHHLPSLHHGGVWVSGYGQIVDHLASHFVHLDRHLDASQRAHVAAYSAFLSAQVAPLVRLSLYVSAANWSATTRPAYSAILPFPLTWTVPPLIRAEAVSHVRQLGLAELDADLDPSSSTLNAGRDVLPEALRRRLPATSTKSVRDEMTPEQAAAIRLTAVIEASLSVLDAQLKGRPALRFVHDASSVSSLDCLAYGYLALMLKPDVPRAFLRDWILSHAPLLSSFVDAMTPTDLPWLAPEPPTLFASSLRFFDSLVRNVPTLGEMYADEVTLRARRGIRGLDRRILTLMAVFTAAGLAVGYGFYTYSSLQPFGAASQAWRCCRSGSGPRYGEFGSMLTGALGLCRAAAYMPFKPAVEGRLIEVDSEVD